MDKIHKPDRKYTSPGLMDRTFIWTMSLEKKEFDFWTAGPGM